MSNKNPISNVDHFVHVMLENRSFDHVFGFLYKNKQTPSGAPFEGLTGEEFNLDEHGKKVTVFPITKETPLAYQMPLADPGEGFKNTNIQLFGVSSEPETRAATNKGFIKNFAATLDWQRKDPNWRGPPLPQASGKDIMGCFTPEMLPVLSGLAKGYAVCDYWFCSVPSETLPNRCFAATATSLGCVDDSIKAFQAPTIYSSLSKANIRWKMYGYSKEPLSRSLFADTADADNSHFGLFTDFQTDAKNGKLPAYSFLEPDFGYAGNSHHPDSFDVTRAENFIYETYHTLRKSPNWHKTLLIITCDEHGGCYDHVSPPTCAVAPDDSPGEFSFDFKRFGVRVPTVLVSPLIPPGTVFRVSEGSMPLDHTSVLKTLEVRFGLKPLTKRDAAASDIGAVCSLDKPRTDDALRGIKPPPPASIASHLQGKSSKLEDVHAKLKKRS